MLVRELPPSQVAILMELALNPWCAQVATIVVNADTVKPLEPALKDVHPDIVVPRTINVVPNALMAKLLKEVATMECALLDILAGLEISVVQVNSIILQVKLLFKFFFSK